METNKQMGPDFESAIETVQDIIDVAKFRGSAYVAKHNGGIERMENVLACLKMKENKTHD